MARGDAPEPGCFGLGSPVGAGGAREIERAASKSRRWAWRACCSPGTNDSFFFVRRGSGAVYVGGGTCTPSVRGASNRSASRPSSMSMASPPYDRSASLAILHTKTHTRDIKTKSKRTFSSFKRVADKRTGQMHLGDLRVSLGPASNNLARPRDLSEPATLDLWPV